jgi:hypothetical protein
MRPKTLQVVPVLVFDCERRYRRFCRVRAIDHME